jgi:dTDP-4-amino-4,6-dideoxygalactose transaminase
MARGASDELATNGGAKAADDLTVPEWPILASGTRENVVDCLESLVWCRQYGDAEYVERFEEAFAEYHDAEHAIGITNGTAALEVALRTVGLHPGDEVIVTPYTWVSTAMSIVLGGGVPRFVDVEPATYNIDPESLRETITDDTVGVVGVHYAGYPMDLDEIVPICEDHDLFLIEDCAHAQGSEWRGEKVGTFGQVGTFSFQQSKSLTAGEGGAVVVDDDRLAKIARSVHWMGRDPGGELGHVLNSSNHRLSEFLGAVLLAQLDKLPEENGVRQENEALLVDELDDIPGIETKPRDDRITNRGYYCFNFKYDRESFAGVDRETFVEALQAEGVPASLGTHAAQPLYRQPAFSREQLSAHVPADVELPNYRTMHLPGVEEIARRNVTLPHQLLLADEGGIRSVARAVEKLRDHADEL